MISQPDKIHKEVYSFPSLIRRIIVLELLGCIFMGKLQGKFLTLKYSPQLLSLLITVLKHLKFSMIQRANIVLLKMPIISKQ